MATKKSAKKAAKPVKKTAKAVAKPKKSAKKPVKDVSTAVLVKGIKQWAVFEEKAGAKTVRTVFKIT